MSEFLIKFLFADASTMEETFGPEATVGEAKMKLISNWPAGKDPVSTPDDLRMIYAGKVLENAKTFQGT